MSFANPFINAWRERIKALGKPGPLVLHPEPNEEAEDLTCLVCGRGGIGQHGVTPEWTVTMRTPSQTITAGVHDGCLRTHQGSRFAKEGGSVIPPPPLDQR